MTKSPQKALVQGSQGFAVSPHRRVGQNRGEEEVVAYPRLGASAALRVDPDVLRRKGSVSKRCRKWAVSVGLLTSAMILPFWGSSRYLASWLWGHMSVSRNSRCGPLLEWFFFALVWFRGVREAYSRSI